jgi:signal peptidase I
MSNMAQAKKKEGAGELFKTVVYALLIAGLFRTILFQPFYIPSGSMKSTLLVGDYLFISKYAYGYSAASCPTVFGVNLCPFLGDARILSAEPERGDVIVFKHPRTREDYIKRVVGLPGETISVERGVLHIDGQPVAMERDGVFVDDQTGRSLERWIETLPGDGSHVVLNTADGLRFDDTPPVTVPEGHYFFMGDNRDNSRDSREPRAAGGVGFVPFQNLVGRAEIIAISSAGAFWELWNWRLLRSFTLVR